MKEQFPSAARSNIRRPPPLLPPQDPGECPSLRRGETHPRLISFITRGADSESKSVGKMKLRKRSVHWSLLKGKEGHWRTGAM